MGKHVKFGEFCEHLGIDVSVWPETTRIQAIQEWMNTCEELSNNHNTKTMPSELALELMEKSILEKNEMVRRNLQKEFLKLTKKCNKIADQLERI